MSNFKFYLSKPIALSLVAIAVGLWGLWSMFHLPMKMYPNVIKPGFRINIHHSDLSTPEDLYKSYGIDVEEQIRKIKGVEKLEATYNSGWGHIRIECEWDVDEEEIKQKLEAIFSPIQASSNQRFAYNVQTSQEQGSGNMMVAVGDKLMSQESLREFLEVSLKPQLERIKGVKGVYFWGWHAESPVVEVDRARLLASPVSLEHLISEIKKGLGGQSLGDLTSEKSSNKIKVVVPPKSGSLDQLLDLVIYSDVKNNVILHLRDLAQVSRQERGSTNLFLLDGHPARFLNVVFDPTGDVKRSSDDVVKKLSDLKKDQNSLDFQVIVNPSTYIENAIANLVINALLGGAIAALILLGFLKNFRSTLVVGLSIPFCIIFAFIMMQIFNVTVNIISLGGLAIGVGMIVDSSIVALENIFRRLQTEQVKDKLDQIVLASKEVALPILSSILTSIVVFFPIIYTSSYTRAILGDLAKTVVFTLTGSIIAALVIVPIASYSFLNFSNIRESENKKNLFSQFFDKLNHWHQRTLSFLLKNNLRGILFIAMAFVTFFLSLLIFPKIKKEIIAVPSTNLFDISINLQDNEDIGLTKKYADRVAEYVKKLPEVKQFATYFWSPSFGFVTAELYDRDDFKKLKERFNKDFEDNPEAQIEAQKWSPGTLPLPREVDLTIDVTGGTQSQRQELVENIMTYQSEIGGHFRQQPWKANNEGILVNYYDWVKNTSQITPFVQAASEKGIFIDRYIEEGKAESLYLAYTSSQRASSLVDLERLPVSYNNKIVPLKALAQVKMKSESYTPIRRVDEKSLQSIDVKINGEVKKEIKEKKVQQLKSIIAGIQKPMELSVLYPDTNKELTASLDSFKFSLFLSLALVFLIIALMFNSIKYPIIILMSVPLSFIGFTILKNKKIIS